jgi:predicted acylesterase/phospholipase RssA
MNINIEPYQAIRKPLQEVEALVIRTSMADPSSIDSQTLSWLRYIISFARLGIVRNAKGVDIDLRESLSRHRWWIYHRINPLFEQRHPSTGLLNILSELVTQTQILREQILEHTDLDLESLQAEVCQRQLVVVSGGGGGGGYGYAGVMQALHRCGLQPQLLSGTSIGALVSMFRARTEVFDQLPMVEAVRRLRWKTVFRMLDVSNRYGVPATLRLYLRDALGSMFVTKDNRSVTFNDCEIPLLIVTTGLTVDAFKHDLSYYEHLMDDAVQTRRFRPSRIARVIKFTGILYEFFSNPEALREVVFGADEITKNADVLDAAGFSAAVPGLIHYDVLRDDPRMKHLLDKLYAEHGITRLTEGGLVNNIPVKPAFSEVINGRITRRNPFVLALDCFSPQMTSPWYPIQQLVVANVRQNLRYADYYFTLSKRLNAINVVPRIEQASWAIEQTSKEIQSHMPFIRRMCSTHEALPFEKSLVSGMEDG